MSGPREWLVTNGLGGYAMGTVDGARARRYHGMLVAALQPPVGRWLLAGGLLDGLRVGEREYPLTGRAVLVRGQVETTPAAPELGFSLEDGTPTWSLTTAEAHLEKRVFMAHGSNTTYLRYTLERADAPVVLRIAVTAACRDHHHLTRAHPDVAAQVRVTPTEHGLRVRLGADAPPLLVLGDRLGLRPDVRWRRGEYLALEDERGFDCVEDELVVAQVEQRVPPGGSVTLVLSAEAAPEADGDRAYAAHRAHQAALLDPPGLSGAPEGVRQLVRASDQFIVRRTRDDGAPGHTVIAGYPWFGDWGRDTMIALPGLTLATGRYDVARDILLTFARYVDAGMVPNRFPDSGTAPEYNTADATLWYVEAVRAHHAVSGDLATLRELFPVLNDIVAHHVAGTRYGIGVDPGDGLLRAGDPGTNLTWMDARVDGVAVTPRYGKPVELSALWINALTAIREFARLLAEPDDYSDHLERASASFGRFWNADRDHLFDVLDPDDPTLRPNQLIAAMLPTVPLTTGQRRSIADACQVALYTPYGLRTLAPDDPDYRGRFVGGPRTRDAMYHRGPAWSWLLGPFLSAHLRAHGDREAVRAMLDVALGGLGDGCVGSVNELFDGDPPFSPRGASAQAWGVAELLRVWQQLERGPAP